MIKFSLLEEFPFKLFPYRNMARKKNKKSKKQQGKSSPLQTLTPEALTTKAHLLIDQGKFREAIACCKQLLKKDSSHASIHLLEQAFSGRIQELTKQSMTKEALALIDVMLQFCPDATTSPLKLSLLIQNGQYVEASTTYAACRDQLSSAQKEQIETLFGALLLDQAELDTNAFPADSPLALHLPHARNALLLFTSQRTDELQQALRKIPIRSPYRDLRILLSGLSQLKNDEKKAIEFMGKIGKDSPYYQMIPNCCLENDAPLDILVKIASATGNSRKQIREQQNVSIRHFRALEELAAIGDNPSSLYNTIRRHEKCFTHKERRKILWHIIPFIGEYAIDILLKCSDFNKEERLRLAAITAEKDGAIEFAVDFWDDYYDLLDLEDPSQHLKAAMVLRKQAELMSYAGYRFPAQDIVEIMLESLLYDPEHATTWIKAADIAKKQLSRNQYYSILRDASAKLPDNVPILLAAMMASGERGAHKQAAGLAAKVLKIDPINTTALDFLVESRLEHARKLAAAKKWKLAENELENADTRVTASHLKGRRRICLGMLLLLQKKKNGLEQIAAGCAESGSPLLARILTSIEARLFHIPVTRQQDMARELRKVSKATQVVNRSEILQIISWLFNLKGEQQQILESIFSDLKSYFARAATLDWKPEEGLKICKALQQSKLPAVLIKYTKALQKKYPQVLEFQVWHIIGESLKIDQQPTGRDLSRLEVLLQRLETDNKDDFVDEIDTLMEKAWGPSHIFFDDAWLDDDDFNPFDLFPLPEKKPKKEKKQPAPKKQSSPGRQLTIFDLDS